MGPMGDVARSADLGAEGVLGAAGKSVTNFAEIVMSVKNPRINSSSISSVTRPPNFASDPSEVQPCSSRYTLVEKCSRFHWFAFIGSKCSVKQAER